MSQHHEAFTSLMKPYIHNVTLNNKKGLSSFVPMSKVRLSDCHHHILKLQEVAIGTELVEVQQSTLRKVSASRRPIKEEKVIPELNLHNHLPSCQTRSNSGSNSKTSSRSNFSHTSVKHKLSVKLVRSELADGERERATVRTEKDVQKSNSLFS